MSIWQRITSFFSSLFTKKPSTNPAPVSVAPPPPPLVAPGTPAPAPVPPAAVTPASYLKIRGLIAGWRAAGLSWQDISYNLQTAAGLGRALSDDEWKVAVASGFPAELLVKPVDTGPTQREVTAPAVLEWTDAGGTLPVGKVGPGSNIFLDGTVKKTITGVPGALRGSISITSAPARTFTCLVNGADIGLHEPQQSVYNFDCSGPEVTIDMRQDADCSLVMQFQH